MAVLIENCYVAFGMPTEEQRRSPVVFHEDLAFVAHGKIRFRFRPGWFAEIFIQNDSGIRRFALEWMGGHWFVNPERELGANLSYET